ncbi:hypothetical protein F53441_1249 [Fusarium austroafricanum]|uniref:Nephrocystin 3-like N-terminal domain-containing protein n=1 Tax=Fusarium austroafricanum TaxID=2364996 RepID=A0A8H4P488_9HYPO|nr:hypothetical protein F53441_1249 [Fusarium austroafricanum]
MAEAIGLAASIAGLVQLTGAVFKLTTKFCREAKDAPSKAQELATQARDLAGIFENLRLLASSLETRNSDSSLKTEHIDSCQSTLDEINKRLDKAQADFDSGKPGKRFSRRLKWPFSLSETKDLVADLSSHRANLTLALSADSMDSLLKSLAKQDEIHNLIERKLSFDTRVELNKRRKEVMNFFLRVKPQDYLDVSRELRHEATGSWLTNDNSTFERWKNGSNSKLWLSGIPGSGKTVLCGLVIETVLQESDSETAVCYAFCDYKNPDSFSPENIIAALAVQLGLQREEAFDELEAYFDMLHPEDKLPTQPRLDDLLDLVGCMAQEYEKVFLVVDGLDECGDEISEMTQALKSIVINSDTVSAAFFSRKEEDIREQLEEDFDHIEVSAHIKDLEDYTLAEVSKRKVLKRIEESNPELYKDILHTLVQGAQGMFRWVACQIDHICNLPNNRARRKALRELPPTLNETYDRVLQRVMQYPPETQACVRRVLQWTALGQPKMEITALCEAVSLQEDTDDLEQDDAIDPGVISRHCGCFLRQSLDGKYFEFAHFTVLEYLQQTQVGDFRYSEDEAYRSFASTAIRFLLLPCFDRAPTIFQITENAHEDEKNRRHPFYRIASQVPLGMRRSFCDYPTRSKILEQQPVLSLLERLFDIQKSSHYKAWVYTLMTPRYHFAVVQELTASPLNIAAFLISPKLCSFALTKGADGNHISNGLTPLLMTLDHIQDEVRINDESNIVWTERQIQTMQVLLEHGADVTLMDRGRSSLACAFDVLGSHVLIHFVRPYSVMPDDAVEAFSSVDWLADHDSMLLQAIVDISTGDNACPQWKPFAALALSYTRKGDSALPDQSVNSLANAYSDEDYTRALDIAVSVGLVGELSILVADPRFAAQASNPSSASELLRIVAYSKSPSSGQILELLLDSGIDPKVCGVDGFNGLHFSCMAGKTDLVSILLARGLDPSVKDVVGKSLWHIASLMGHDEILQLLFKEDESALENLSQTDSEGQTPFYNALRSGNVETCLILLELCPSEPKYFQPSNELLNSAAAAGSQALFSKLLATGIDDSDHTKSQSTPMHHLTVLCTVEFARYLATMYDPLCLSGTGSFPFEIFFHHWLSYNREVRVGETIPLDANLLDLLLPKNYKFSKNGQTFHAWEFICTALGEEGFCCRPGGLVLGMWADYFSRDFRTIIDCGIVSSYEEERKESIVLPFIQAWRHSEQKAHTSQPLATLLSDFFEISTINTTLEFIDYAYKLFLLSMWRKDIALIAKLIEYGVDIHRQVSEEVWSSPRSLFEEACETSELDMIESMLNLVSPSSLDHRGPSGLSPLELVIAGSSKHKIAIIRAFSSRRVAPNSDTLKLPLVSLAGRKSEWVLAKSLAEEGYDILAVDKDGWSPAHHAVIQGNLDILMWVVGLTPEGFNWKTSVSWLSDFKKGSQYYNEHEEHDVSFLHLAAGQPSCLAYFLDNHLFTNVNMITQSGRTPLHFASSSGSLSSCEQLIHHGADLGARDLIPLPQWRSLDPGDLTWRLPDNADLELTLQEGFESAIRSGNLERCKFAVSQGCSINKPLPSCHSCTPLFLAIRASQDNVINWLLDEGASTDSVSCYHTKWENAVVHAVRNSESATCLEKILTAALHQRTTSYHSFLTAIHGIVDYNDFEMSELLLRHFDDNVETYYNSNLWSFDMDYDLQVNTTKELKSLLLNQPVTLPRRKETSLYCAAMRGSIKIVKLLIRHGADVNVSLWNHETPLTVAAARNHVAIAEELLFHGASVDARKSRGETPMAIAVRFGNLEMVKLLEQANPSALQYMDASGANLLFAAAHSSSRIFNYLASKGVDPYHYNREGDSMLSIALCRPNFLEYVNHSRIALLPPPHRHRSPMNVLTVSVIENETLATKMLYLSLPPEVASVLINQDNGIYGTPLCSAVDRGDADMTKLLLELGANIEQVGSVFGTPLMSAITCGRMELVKLLVRRGAKLECILENGVYKSGVKESLPHPEITQWLLVGRYQDQKQLANSTSNDGCVWRPWSGIREVVMALDGSQRRRWSESTLDYCIRLGEIKHELRGKRIRGKLL